MLEYKSLTFFNEVCGALINEKTNLCSTQLLSDNSYMTCFNSYHKVYLAGFSETILNNVSKYITWSLFTLRESNLVRWHNLSVILYMYMEVSVYRLGIKTRPSFPHNLGVAYLPSVWSIFELHPHYWTTGTRCLWRIATSTLTQF